MKFGQINFASKAPRRLQSLLLDVIHLAAATCAYLLVKRSKHLVAGSAALNNDGEMYLTYTK